MATLFNTKTRLPETLPPDKVAAAIASGTHSYRNDDRVNIVGQDGQVRNVAGNEVLDAFQQGYNLETPRQAAVREFVDENKGLTGTAKVALGQFADEALFGVPETAFDLTADPLDVAKKEALKKEHLIANTLGGAAGFGASMFYGGPIFKGAALAGRAAERGILGIGEEAILKGAGKAAAEYTEHAAAAKLGAQAFEEGTTRFGFPEGVKFPELSAKLSERNIADFEHQALKARLIENGYPASQADYAAAGLIRRTVASAANMGVQAGVIAAPKEITEALLGDPEQAAEHLLYNIGAGAALGGLGSMGGSLARAAKNVAIKYENAAITDLAKRQAALDLVKFAESKVGRPLNIVEKEQLFNEMGVKSSIMGIDTAGLKEAAEVSPITQGIGKASSLGAGLGGAALDVAMGGSGIAGAATALGIKRAAQLYVDEPYKIVDGLLFAEKAMKKSAEKLDGVSKYLTEKVSPNAIYTTQMNAISRFIGEDVSHLSQNEQLDAMNKKLHEIESNPDLKTERIANITTVLDQGGAPKIAQALNLKMTQLYSYLTQILPRTKLDTNQFMNDKTKEARSKVPDNEIKDFQRALSVILDPYIVFEKLGAGTLTTSEVQAMKEFYPGIFERGVQKIMTDPQQVNYSMRLKLQQLTGADMGTGVANTAAFQASFGKGSKKQQQIGPVGATIPKFAPSKLNLYGGGPKQPNIAMTATQNLLRNK